MAHAARIDAGTASDADRAIRQAQDWIALLVTLLVAAFLVWPRLDRGWVSRYDGMLSQTADRIRLGQLPHRDFEEIYTEALGYWHALAQQIVGISLVLKLLVV